MYRRATNKRYSRKTTSKRTATKKTYPSVKKSTYAPARSYFQLDQKKYKKTAKSYNRATTYFKVVGYNKFVKKYSVAVYVSGHFFDTRMMTGEQIKSFGVKYYSKLKIN